MTTNGPQGPQGDWVPPPGYGSPAPGIAPSYDGSAGVQTESMAIASLVLGILSIPGHWCCHLGVPMGIAAVVLGILSISKINKEPQRYGGKGLAIGGIVAAVVGVALIAALIAVYGVAIMMSAP